MYAVPVLTPQSWIGRPRFLLDGVIFRYDADDAEAETWKKPKQVPSDKVVAHIEGNWMKQIRYRLKGEKVCSAEAPCRWPDILYLGFPGILTDTHRSGRHCLTWTSWP